MLSAGINIQMAGDPLKPLSVEHLYNSLTHPTSAIEARINQLRIVRQTDQKLYARAKRLLPYFVCGVFNPQVRKTENFAYTNYFIIDLDNFSEKAIDLTSVREKIEKDSRVVLSFLSPSEDGLKVMFRFKERCYDAGLYSVFYKEFVRRFSQQYQLEQVADGRTSDVARACFISIDRNAYYNPEAEPVDMEEFLNVGDSTFMTDLMHEQAKEEKAQAASVSPSSEEEPRQPEPDDVAMDKIRDLLNEHKKAKDPVPRLPIYVPARLEAMMEGIRAFVEKQGVSVYELVSIQYGKKIKCKLGERLAEINLFYGKRGFRVVQSPKAIVSADLNAVVAELIQLYVDENT